MEVNSYEIEIHVVVIASSQDLLRRIFETLNRKVVLLGEQGGALNQQRPLQCLSSSEQEGRNRLSHVED